MKDIASISCDIFTYFFFFENHGGVEAFLSYYLFYLIKCLLNQMYKSLVIKVLCNKDTAQKNLTTLNYEVTFTICLDMIEAWVEYKIEIKFLFQFMCL